MPDPDPLWWIRMRKPAGSKNDTEDWLITKLVNWKCYCKNWISFMERRVKEFTVCFLAVDWSLGNNDRKTSGLVRYTVHSTYICTGGHWHSPDSEVLLQANPRGVMWTWLRFVSVSLLVTVYSSSLYLTGVNCERFSLLVFIFALLTCECLSGIVTIYPFYL
jgi:hypothetical protein